MKSRTTSIVYDAMIRFFRFFAESKICSFLRNSDEFKNQKSKNATSDNPYNSSNVRYHARHQAVTVEHVSKSWK